MHENPRYLSRAIFIALTAGAAIFTPCLCGGLAQGALVTSWNAAVNNTADFNTTGSGSFTWSDSAAWVGAAVPGSTAGQNVSVEPRQGIAATITVDTNVTLGTLDSRSQNVDARFTGTGKLIFDNGVDPAVWNLNSRTTRFTALRTDAYVDMQLNSNLDFRMGAARQEEATVGRIGKVISGSGALTLTLGNNDSTATRLFKLGATGANTYEGGTTIRHISQIPYGSGYATQNIVQLNALSTGAFGTGDVTINGAGATATSLLAGVGTGRGMWVRFSADEVMAIGSTLNILTSDRVALELLAGTNQSLGGLFVNGSPIADGIYTGGNFDWLYGTGTLTVSAIPEPAVTSLLSLLGLSLTGFGYYRTRGKK